MTTSTQRAGDKENRFPAHYSEADQMARFSSTGGCRYNNGKDKVALLAMYIMIRHILWPVHRKTRLHHPGAVSRVSPSSSLGFLIPREGIFCWYRLVMVSPILCSKDVGEGLARWFPSRLSTRISRNPVVRGIRVLATICKSFEGEEINKENIS